MKKFLAALLAIALVITGLYPTQWAKAATTTTSGSGLDFWTPEYDYYESQEVFGDTPATFEATIRVTSDADVWIPGYICANTSADGSMGDGFAFGLYKRCIPELTFIKDGQKYTYYFPRHGSNSPDEYSNWTVNCNPFFRNTDTGASYWVHVAIVNYVGDTADDSYMQCYLNGTATDLPKQVATCFSEALNQELPMIIGSDWRTQRTKSFKGEIKDVAIFSTPRTEAEVLSDYENGIVGDEEGLLAAYQLDLGADGKYPETIEDLTGLDTMTRHKRLLTWEEKEAIYELGDYDYSMAVVGDPQVLVAHDAKGDSYPEGGDPYVDGQAAKMFDWVVGNKDDLKMKWAFNMGDTTDSYAPNGTEDLEWDIGSAAVKKLDGNVPYSLARGNHDAADKFVEHFAWSDYKDSVSGSYEESMLNTYQKFEVNGIKYLVMNIDFGVSDNLSKANNIIKWANDVTEANPDYNVIVTTHGYLTSEGVRNGQEFLDYYKGKVTKSAENLWDEYVKHHENIVMVISGHVDAAPVVWREVYGVNGNKVVEIAVNAQEDDVAFAGNMYAANETDPMTMTGAVGMMYFSNGGRNVAFEYYSTLWGQYYTEESQFQFTLDLVDSDVYESEDGTVALAYDQVINGEVPTPRNGSYADYTFAGWYTGAGCTADMAITDKAQVNESSYAKFVPSDLLNVKTQVSTKTLASGTHAGKWAVRFVSSVDDTTYKAVGFKVTEKESGKLVGESSSNHVYKKISSSEEEIEYGFSPDVISDSSSYVFTIKMPVADTEAAKATDYVVQAYYETFDGTKVYGPKRVIAVNDGVADNVLNLTVDAELTGSGYTATYTTDVYAQETSAKVDVTVVSAENGQSNIRVALTPSALCSASKIIIYDANGTEVASEVYRNYYTSHLPYAGASWTHEDYSWYYLPEEDGHYVLGSSADLYGFARMIVWGDTFTDKTIELARDIEVNVGKAVRGTSSTAAYWDSQGNDVKEWNIAGGNWGSASNSFNGTLDGNGNTISGLYMTGNDRVGMFRSLATDASIKNIGIINSYIENTGDYTGVFTGFSYGVNSYENVYTDAVINSGNATGGFVGWAEAVEDEATLFESCWFDGQLYVSGYGLGAGGVAGLAYDSGNTSTFRFRNCLFTGDILETGTYAYPNMGGIFGQVATNTSTVPTILFENCLSTGTMSSTHSTGGFGAISGWSSNLTSASHGTNCYGIKGNGYTYNCPNGGGMSFTNSEMVDSLVLTTQAEVSNKFPALPNCENDPWICTENGTPILEQFSAVWLKKQQ